MTKRLVQLALTALCLVTFAGLASAQVFTGRIDITAKDGTGGILPGVTVELTGPQSANATTDSQGEAHFLNLAPGKYTVTAKLSGFNNYKNDNVPVNAGDIVPLGLTMMVGNVAASVEVTATTPVIEAKRTAISTTVTLDELQNIPTSRDPWVILQTVPGVVVDRVNVGGAESGQQSNFQAKGARGQDNTWNMDGIAITDMAALGSSPTYYDFDMFQEMQITTGGADVTTATPGVGLNMVLKSGTNRFRGSGRYYFETNGMQADNLSTDLTAQIRSYNRMQMYTDTGFEVGGPIVKDKLWFWGAYGYTNPRLRIYTYDQAGGTTIFNQGTDSQCTPTGTTSISQPQSYNVTARDCTTLKNTSVKVNGDINTATHASFTFFEGNKEKFGRSAGPTRPAETTWDQTGPTRLYKVEINRTVSDSLFVTGRYAHVQGGFSLTPIGGTSGNVTAWQDADGIWHGTYLAYNTTRPQDVLEADATDFMGMHELKFGFGYRKSSVTSDSAWPGGIVTFDNGYPDLFAQVTRNAEFAGHSTYWNAYAGDVITKDRWTVNLGVRWDRQASSVEALSIPAAPLDPVNLPALNVAAQSSVIVYNTLTPRIGVTYALGNDRKTLLRASYSRFADQLDSNLPFTLSINSPYYAYAYWYATDKNGDHQAQKNEFTSFLGTNIPQATAGSYKTPKTDEFVIGADRELMPNFGLSGSWTYRHRSDQNWVHLVGVNGNDYTQTSTLTGNIAPVGPYSVPIYTLNPAAFPANNETVFESRPGYTRVYKGVEIVATKRMANNWMMRMSFSGGTNREYFDNLGAKADPTPTLPGQQEWTLGSPNVNGGVVVTQTSGSGKSNIYIVLPKYQYVLTAAYQAKWDVNFGFNYLLRQGYATPYYYGASAATLDSTTGIRRNVVVVPDIDASRLPAVNSVDGRVSKAFNYKNYTVNVDLDCFNMFNNATPLGKQYDVRKSTFNNVLEITNPRIFRLGFRVSFK